MKLVEAKVGQSSIELIARDGPKPQRRVGGSVGTRRDNDDDDDDDDDDDALSNSSTLDLTCLVVELFLEVDLGTGGGDGRHCG